MEIISIKKNEKYVETAIKYFQKIWASENTMMVYEDCLSHTIGSESSLPQWYLLVNGDEIIGCAGLITNDFISRMDLFPWLCAVYIEEKHRGNAFSKLLVERAKKDSREAGFRNLYLCTDHIGFYEKHGFEYVGDGYHPWGKKSRIYKYDLV